MFLFGIYTKNRAVAFLTMTEDHDYDHFYEEKAKQFFYGL